MIELDVTGLTRPAPILKIRRALMTLKAGERLEVTGDDPDLISDVPAFCTQAGHRLVMAHQHGKRLVFELARGTAPLSATPENTHLYCTG